MITRSAPETDHLAAVPPKAKGRAPGDPAGDRPRRSGRMIARGDRRAYRVRLGEEGSWHVDALPWVSGSADIYRGPWDMPWPPAIGNIGEVWSRGQLGVAYVTAMTVAVVLALSVTGAYALTRLRPPGRAVLFLLVLAPLIVPTEVLIVPLFSMFRALGLINSLPGLALVKHRRIRLVRHGDPHGLLPHDPAGPGRRRPDDGAGRIGVLVGIVIPLARPGILAVAILVAVLTWNDFGASLVLIQRPEAFTVQLALGRFSTVLRHGPGTHLCRHGDRDLAAVAPLPCLTTKLHPGSRAEAVRR